MEAPIPDTRAVPHREKHGFSRLKRVTKSYVFHEIFMEGFRFSSKLIVLHVKRSRQPGLRVGVVAGRRLFRRAVDRSRAKRVMREAWRLNQNNIKGDYDILMVAKSNILKAARQDVEKELMALADKAGIWSRDPMGKHERDLG